MEQYVAAQVGLLSHQEVVPARHGQVALGLRGGLGALGEGKGDECRGQHGARAGRISMRQRMGVILVIGRIWDAGHAPRRGK